MLFVQPLQHASIRTHTHTMVLCTQWPIWWEKGTTSDYIDPSFRELQRSKVHQFTFRASWNLYRADNDCTQLTYLSHNSLPYQFLITAKFALRCVSPPRWLFNSDFLFGFSFFYFHVNSTSTNVAKIYTEGFWSIPKTFVLDLVPKLCRLGYDSSR